MQCYTLHTHTKYHCKNLETENVPKEEYPNCSEMQHKTTIRSHLKNGSPKKNNWTIVATSIEMGRQKKPKTNKYKQRGEFNWHTFGLRNHVKNQEFLSVRVIKMVLI